MKKPGSLNRHPHSATVVLDEDLIKAITNLSRCFKRLHKLLSSDDVLLSSEGTMIVRGANVGTTDLIRPPFSTLRQLAIARLHRLTHTSPHDHQHDRRSAVRLWRMVRGGRGCIEGKGQNPTIVLNALRKTRDRTKTRNQVLRDLKHCDDIYEPMGLGKGGEHG